MGRFKDTLGIDKWNVFSVGPVKTCISCKTEKKNFDYSDINKNDLFQSHHVLKRARTLSVEEIYSILISKSVNKPTSNINFEHCLKMQLLIEVNFTCHRV